MGGDFMVLRIKQLRLNSQLNQVQLAAAMGVSQGVISNWESEVILPRTRDLPRLAQVLGCKIGDLFTEEAAQ